MLDLMLQLRLILLARLIHLQLHLIPLTLHRIRLPLHLIPPLLRLTLPPLVLRFQKVLHLFSHLARPFLGILRSIRLPPLRFRMLLVDSRKISHRTTTPFLLKCNAHLRIPNTMKKRLLIEVSRFSL